MPASAQKRSKGPIYVIDVIDKTWFPQPALLLEGMISQHLRSNKRSVVPRNEDRNKIARWPGRAMSGRRGRGGDGAGRSRSHLVEKTLGVDSLDGVSHLYESHTAARNELHLRGYSKRRGCG